MNDYNCTEGCKIHSDSNEIKIMIKKLDRQVKKFFKKVLTSMFVCCIIYV